MMQTRLSLLLLALLLAASALPAGTAHAQSRDELRGLRDRTWNEAQVQRWLDAQASKRFVRASAQQDCPDFTDRRDAVLNGNKITTQIFNFGSISAPGNTITNVVWNGLGYGYEFGPFVAAQVVDRYKEEGRRRDPQSVPLRDDSGDIVFDAEGDTTWVMRIVSDGLVSNGGEVSPDGSTFWGWQPIPCAQSVGNFAGLQVVEPTSDKIPTSDAQDTDLDGRPDSWPEDWYNETLERYVWPGALQQGASNADKEAIYFMNDYNNCEFAYDPFPSDPDLNCGLGLEVEVRLYQWANPLAEDAIFLIYKITNKSERDLENVRFGMWGDPHVGGPSNWQDDLAFFDEDLNMVFAWDADGRSDVAGREPGYFGYKFLESPGVDDDGIDNDGDGLVDESWTDGIDNDGDWDPDTDDVGLDGLAGTADEGEGDGVPTAGDPFDITKPGEPNFEFTDIDESDELGLTSFASPPFSGNRISNDDRVWGQIAPGEFEQVPSEPGDYVFLYGAGTFRLRAGDTKRFSIALILGANFEDLRQNAETVQQIYNVGYRFAKPPDKPVVRAVPGDEQVTLYWDARAESSVDPLTGENDFEGYAIYRSTDPEFSDQQTITDVNGTGFLFRPLTNALGVEAKFDLRNGISGPSEIPYPRRGVAYDLGDDTGLFHTYVDSNNVVNGQRYFYTVVAYDRGFAGDASELGEAFSGGIPPSETTKTITYDPTTDSYTFDLNTVSVVPRPAVAGYVPPALIGEDGIAQTGGAGTGAVRLEIVDPLAIPDDTGYVVDFDDTDDGLAYSVVLAEPVSVPVTPAPGKTSQIGFTNIVPGSFTLTRADGRPLAPDDDYTLNAELGTVVVNASSGVSADEQLVATFRYAPLYQSTRLAGEEGNLVFDGLHLFIADDPLEINQEETGWIEGDADVAYDVRVAVSGPGRIPQPADYEVRFADSPVTTSVNNDVPLPFEIINLTRANQPIDAFAPDIDRDGQWDVGESIIFIEEVDGRQIATWQLDLVNEEGTVAPDGGDVFYLRTRKPFSADDQFSFRTRAATTDLARVEEELDEIYAVPNPYVVTAAFEPRNPVSRTERGERRMYFANVPQRCTIRIYSLAGELVDTIEHDSTLDDGKAYWDLRTKDNMNVAYGLYLFHVDTEAGEYIGKFAVIK